VVPPGLQKSALQPSRVERDGRLRVIVRTDLMVVALASPRPAKLAILELVPMRRSERMMGA